MNVAEHATQRYTLGDEALPCNPSIMAAKHVLQGGCSGQAGEIPVNHTKYTQDDVTTRENRVQL